MHFDGFLTVTFAILVLFVGKYATDRFALLRRFTIPDPLVGGLLCAVVLAIAAAFADFAVTFASEPRDFLLILFFAAIGLRANIKDLVQGGLPLLILIAVSSVFLAAQNVIGMAAATLYGYDPLLGVASGSMSLVGGVGTTVAWAPIFSERLGITNAEAIGVACNTVGIIGACVIGGPIAQRLIHKHNLSGSADADLEVGELQGEINQTTLSYYDVLAGIFLINVAVVIGYFMHLFLEEVGVTMPMFVPVLVAGILMNNIGMLFAPKFDRDGRNKGIALVSDMCLGIFLSITLMSMDLISLWSSINYVAFVMTLQILFAVVFALYVVFWAMGRDYDAAVISAGFGGIALGSTATAVLNMTSVAQRYGASHKAFLIVPLTCGFFIDIANSMMIRWFTGL
ncbi:sodium/glutamate symporter [Pseudovibrio exalbescens]|uniref:sodium/glutamate symporter n=1 Tax=Pseudovibrio exalbescens TaxID=197461 RepID=UPI00236521F0|nr:sodium/glutamate symporter [Pseudovibrio exalbescens]MDD7909923.1 sodium/glutamate symporter [Pseudovibrio exalbescens]